MHGAMASRCSVGMEGERGGRRRRSRNGLAYQNWRVAGQSEYPGVSYTSSRPSVSIYRVILPWEPIEHKQMGRRRC